MTIPYEHVAPAPLDERAQHFMVRMRDGVRLATDVYLAGDEAAEAILIRLPYDKVGSYTFIPLVAEYFVAHGYHVVAQDVRGKFRSGGETLLFVNEAADGYDTLDWLVEQPWSNGVVGMWGDSYYGYTQWAAVSTNHPALRAMSPRVTGTRLGELPDDSDGGLTRDVEMGVHRLYPCMFFHSNDVYLWEPNWSRRPLAASVEEFFETVGSRSVSYDQWFPHQVRLRRFPFGHPFDAKPIPVLQTIGWWDNCAPWQWSDHWRLVQRQGWAHNEYLLIDSIDHENNHLSEAGRGERELEAVKAKLPAYLDPTIEFFDVFLRDRAPHSSIPRVRWNLAHTEGFLESGSWPPEGIREHVLHLHADGSLRPAPSDAPGTMTWVHDPDDLVPSAVVNAFAFLGEYPDERRTSDRADVLVFEAEAVDSDTDFAGAVMVTAAIASDGPRMDLFTRLLDVDPTGAARLVARGQVHLIECPDDGHVEVDVDLGQVGYRLLAGHRLRLQLASSDFPEFIPQPGNGEHPWLATEVVKNTQSVVVGGPAGARLVLHQLPVAGDPPTAPVP